MEERFRQLMDEAGLSRYTDEVLKLVWNSIRIKTHPVDESDLPLGASKIGGMPDLPEGWEWPWYEFDPDEIDRMRQAFAGSSINKPGLISWIRKFIGLDDVPGITRKSKIAHQPFSFVAQFDMSQVAPYDVDNVLPSAGILYFFFDAANQYAVDLPSWTSGCYRVLHYAGDMNLLRRTDYPEELILDGQFPAWRIQFSGNHAP